MFLFLLTFGGTGASAVDYHIDGAHPRLLLTPRHKRLLERERERQSMRWVQFEALIRGGTPMPEPGFANALFYAAGGGREFGREAIHWARGTQRDLRQTALVFDWCHDLLSEEEKSALTATLEQSIGSRPRPGSVSDVRDRLLAALALAGHRDAVAEAELAWVIDEWWRKLMAPGLLNGDPVFKRGDIYPLAEILHLVRDAARVDLRVEAKQYFVDLPAYLLLSYYPAVYPAAENDYHIPVIHDGGQPDLRDAMLARAANLALVSLDPNSQETQFLQGWSMQDAFVLRSSMGAPYEFFWANPYQPGLSYYNAPLVYYDERGGRLLARSIWDGQAEWFYLENGVMQTFRDGQIQILNAQNFTAPLTVGEVVIWPLGGQRRMRIPSEGPRVFFLLGLKPKMKYDIEVDDEGLYEQEADRSGILLVEFLEGRGAGLRLRPSPR